MFWNVSVPQIGQPIFHEAVSIFPLFTRNAYPVEYILSDEAIGAGVAAIKEITQSGSVPQLLVENTGDTRILFLEGEELIGAKQDRVLNTSVLVPAKSKTTVPVSCVEHGRWSYQSKHFGSAGRIASARLRHTLKRSVTQSLQNKKGHQSNQGAVWSEVERQRHAFGAKSQTGRMGDTFETRRASVEDYCTYLRYVEGASGLAVALNEKFVAIDLFDKPATCQKVWDRLLAGIVLDAIEAGTGQSRPKASDLKGLATRLAFAQWEKRDGAGEGTEYRTEKDNIQATGLFLDRSLIHGSVVIAA